MPKLISHFECDYCKRKYDSHDEAAWCEAECVKHTTCTVCTCACPAGTWVRRVDAAGEVHYLCSQCYQYSTGNVLVPR